MAVIRTIWRQKWFALPAIIIAVAASVYVYAEGPREYEATLSYAVANPQVPTDDELRADPSLKALNNNNPYLRSSDPNLVASVAITRLNSPDVGDQLDAMGLSTEYEAAPAAGGSGLQVAITATGATPQQSLDTLAELGVLFEQNLYDIQKINGADDRYLFTPLVVSQPDRATEKLSSRLRTVVIVGACGLVLVFGAVSLGTWVDNRRTTRIARTSGTNDPDAVAAETTEPVLPRPRRRYRPAPIAASSTTR
ncbi:chain-length determining protein [Microbacterium sp. 10M-3C3]|uniref:chain-length determining protein n=1 Tax=Microbacterium sp. 10M-3C3 TaxID=2483401 RepID=UPI000F643A23|nr:chain-length determining protein [Microbacterium sp. 10M-3C3]